MTNDNKELAIVGLLMGGAMLLAAGASIGVARYVNRPVETECTEANGCLEILEHSEPEVYWGGDVQVFPADIPEPVSEQPLLGPPPSIIFVLPEGCLTAREGAEFVETCRDSHGKRVSLRRWPASWWEGR